jgi:hypothetical protein
VADFPEIRTGVITQRPYTKSRTFRNTTVVMPCGVQYSYKHRDNPLHGRRLTYSGITEAEATILEDFFRARHGRVEAFNFTDPDDGSVFRMRFDQEDLSLRYLAKDQVATEILLIEALAP